MNKLEASFCKPLDYITSFTTGTPARISGLRVVDLCANHSITSTSIIRLCCDPIVA